MLHHIRTGGMAKDRPAFEIVDLGDDPANLEEWIPVGNLLDEDGAPIYYNPETQQMAWSGDGPDSLTSS